MYNSIQQFQLNGIEKLKKIFSDYTDNTKKIAEMVRGVTAVVTGLGLSMISEEWESYDKLLCDRPDLRRSWHVVRKDVTTLTTSLGDVVYHKTLFRNKKTGEYSYLLDDLLGVEKHARMTEDACACMLEEAVESSYRKGGTKASIAGSGFSKETVMSKLHALKFPEIIHKGEKRHVKKIYIDADEDHVSLQYIEKKGDIKKPRTNTAMPRIIYVYEGIDTEESGRPRLINTRYFGGIYDGSRAIKELWGEVYRYLDSAYDIGKVEQIYINGDGAEWIKTGARILPKAKFVLDKYHMHKYIISATSHLKDSAQDARSDIYRAIHKKKKRLAEGVFNKILDITEEKTKRNAVAIAKGYILKNWEGIMLSMAGEDKNIKCSAEGHVSHVFADRMSSRPLGWSRTGADKMSRLRIYRKNKGDMLELVRYQKEGIKLAAGAEEVIYSASQMISIENKNRRRLGKVADIPVYSIPYPQIKKIAALKDHIWGL